MSTSSVIKPILACLTELMILTDPKGKITYMNNVSWLEGRIDKNNLQSGKSLTHLFPAEYKEIIKHIIKDINQEPRAHSFELALSDRDGHNIYLDVTVNPVLSGKILEQICVIGKDITDQKIFKQKNNELLHEISELTENANAVIFSIDTQFYITSWNLECSRITGYEKGDTLAKPFGDFINPEIHTRLFDLFDQVMGGKPIRNFEIQFDSDKGIQAILLLNATPRRSAAGKVVGILFVGQDITELSEYRINLEKKVQDRTKALKEALKKEKQLVEIKNRFVSIASHEFKVPLGAISSSIRALENSGHIDPDEREKLKGIDLHVARMESLLEDVLTLDKTGLPRLNPNKKSLNLVSALKAIINEVITATNHTHRADESYFRNEITIDADEKLLRNVFLNILSNAIKYSPGRKTISVRVYSRQKNLVTVSISDQGIGILPEDMERIFEPFNRGSNSASIEGTGLGLSIVKRATESLGAELEIKSKPGKGTTIDVHFSTSDSE